VTGSSSSQAPWRVPKGYERWPVPRGRCRVPFRSEAEVWARKFTSHPIMAQCHPVLTKSRASFGPRASHTFGFPPRTRAAQRPSLKACSAGG
jgi:hypothetical protein